MQLRLTVWLVLTVAATAVGAGYSTFVGGSPEIGATVGATIGALLMALELFVIQHSIGDALRRLPLPVYIAATTLLWLVIISVCVEYIPRLLDEDGSDHDAPTTFAQDLGASFLVVLVFNSAVRVSLLIGPRVLVNFLLGRYHRPQREERVFMFLDLADSTRLAEELGDIRVQSLIRHFFFDIARPIAEHGGETHRYIGDEIVVTWPMVQQGRDGHWIHCVFEIRKLIARRADWYRLRYGVVPRFRVGMHGGPVVASEVGDEKREIVYFGDTINTAARLGQACKELGRDFLISADLLSHFELPNDVRAQPVGPLTLKGKKDPFSAYALTGG